jgi:hypothetical protein
MVDEIDLGIKVQEVEIGAFDSFLVLVLLLGLEKVTLDELVIVIGLYGRTGDAPLLLVLSQFFLNLHLYLLEDLQLPFVSGRLLTALAANIDVIADCFVGDGAGVTQERPTVRQVGGACGNQLC